MKNIKIMLAGLLVLSPMAANAGILLIEASGELADTSLSFPSILVNGDTSAFTFSYDTSAPDVEADPDIYVASGGNVWSTRWSSYAALGVGNSITYFNSFGLVTLMGYSEIQSEEGGILGNTIAPDFLDGGANNEGAIFSAVALELILDSPTVNPNLVADALLNGAFTARSFWLFGRPLDYPADGNFAFRYESDITDVKIISVPEPGTLGLLGAGMLGLRFMRRRRAG